MVKHLTLHLSNQEFHMEVYLDHPCSFCLSTTFRTMYSHHCQFVHLQMVADDCTVQKDPKWCRLKYTIRRRHEQLAEIGIWWQLKFHPSKCQLLRVNNKGNQHPTSYNIHGHINLELVGSAKYLGVTTHKTIIWNT